MRDDVREPALLLHRPFEPGKRLVGGAGEPSDLVVAPGLGNAQAQVRHADLRHPRPDQFHGTQRPADEDPGQPCRDQDDQYAQHQRRDIQHVGRQDGGGSMPAYTKSGWPAATRGWTCGGIRTAVIRWQPSPGQSVRWTIGLSADGRTVVSGGDPVTPALAAITCPRELTSWSTSTGVSGAGAASRPFSSRRSIRSRPPASD